MEDNELDDILDSALNDFEDDEDDHRSKSNNNNNNNDNTSSGTSSGGGQGLESFDGEFMKFIEKLAKESDANAENSANDLGDADEERLINKLAEGMSKIFAKHKEELEGQETSDNGGDGGDTSSSRFNADELQSNIEKTLKMLQENAAGIGNIGKDSSNVDTEDILNKLMDQFQDLEGNQEFQGVMENMMRQLMSKDVLYEPMQEIRSKYPLWLSENVGKLSNAEIEKYQKQFEYVSQICEVYETDPENFQKIIELMQAMQECGQPPEGIVNQLSGAGLESLSNIAGSGGGGGGGGADGGDSSNCSIM